MTLEKAKEYISKKYKIIIIDVCDEKKFLETFVKREKYKKSMSNIKDKYVLNTLTECLFWNNQYNYLKCAFYKIDNQNI